MTKRVVFVHSETFRHRHYLSCLTTQGFVVDTTTCRHQAARRLDGGPVDLAIVDVDLGDDDRDGGFQLCRELRTRWPALPIILLTRRDNDTDRLSAYRLGADEFLNEHVSPDFLAARSHALLARLALMGENRAVTRALCHGRLRVERPALKAYWDDRPVTLGLQQMRMLVALAEANGESLSLTQLMQAAETRVQPNTVTAAVTRMRRAFRVVDPVFDAIENVHGRGYRWVGRSIDKTRHGRR